MANNQHKFDLCADTVTLDYTELQRLSRLAVRYTHEALQQRLRKWYNIPTSVTNLDAEWMLQDAEALAMATRAMHYLDEGKSREEVIIANH